MRLCCHDGHHIVRPSMTLDDAQQKRLAEAGSLIRNGRSAEAIPTLDSLLEIEPGSLWLWDERVRAKVFSGDHAGALSDSAKRIQLAPEDSEGYMCRAFYVFERVEDIRAAVGDYSSAISLNRSHPRAFLRRGILYVRLGMLSDAISDFTSDMRFSTSGPLSGLLNRGKTKHVLGDLTGAISDLTEAIRLETEPPIYAPLIRGRVLLASGDYHRAIADFGAVIRAYPELPNAYRLRAEARNQTNDQVGAEEDFDAYRKLGGLDFPAYS